MFLNTSLVFKRRLTEESLKKTNAKNSNSVKQKAYKASEYYSYNIYSYFDLENDMVKYRLPQPSSLPTQEGAWFTSKAENK